MLCCRPVSAKSMGSEYHADLFLASQVAASVLQQLHAASSQDSSTFQVRHIVSVLPWDGQHMLAQEAGCHVRLG